MLLAMARDVRVILIKLADRLHNMRTLGAVPPAKRRRIARETMEIYAPIANRLGLNRLYHEPQELSFSEVPVIFGCRVIVKDVPSCYLTLGTLPSLYKPIPGKFKDYIAIPKANGYQSLHTDLIGPYGVPLEVQIRTEQMHHVADSGVASHWMYKDEADKLSELQKQTHRWLQSLLEIQNQSGDPHEFLEHVKVDLFPDEV